MAEDGAPAGLDPTAAGRLRRLGGDDLVRRMGEMFLALGEERLAAAETDAEAFGRETEGEVRQTAEAVDNGWWNKLSLLLMCPFVVWLYPSKVGTGRSTPVRRAPAS